MKKYLMGGIAAVAICAAFTSCSKNNELFDQNAAEQIKQQTSEQKILDSYQKAFENAFGQPGANQDWGLAKYGSVTNAGTRALTRAMNISFDYWEFPDDANANKFLADVPEDVKKYTEVAGENQTGYATGTSYLDPSWKQEVNIWGAWDGSKTSGGILYIKGDNDFTNRKFYIAPNTEVYLLEGSTLTLNAKNASDLQANNLYMAANSKIVAEGELYLNNGLHIYNHGTIEAPKLSTNSNSVLYNVGTVTIAGKISVENDLSAIVNDGTITAADLNTAGSGKFENNGNTTITGTTFVNSNNNTWVNNGQYRTGNFIYNAASDEVINNCRLTVDEDFNINLGDNPGNGNFKMNSNSGVVTKYFNGGGNWNKEYSTGSNKGEGGPFYIYMGSNSVFKVTETATMNATKADYGVYGVGNDFAVFSAKKIEAGKANQGYEVTYGGNLYVYAENGHFANGLSGTYPYIDIKDNAKIYASGFEDGKPAVKIEETPCNPGFGDNPPVIVYQGSVMGEDLTAETDNDFDFNDVVFDWAFSADKKTAYIRLRAAGGTLPLRIGTAVGQGEEVHELFGVSTSTMVNTGVGANGITKEPVEFTITKTTGTFNNAADIIVSVDKTSKGSNGYMQMTAKIGQAPCLLFVPLNTKWVDEYENIEKAYTWFGAWSRGEVTTEQWSAPVAKFVDLDLSNNK